MAQGDHPSLAVFPFGNRLCARHCSAGLRREHLNRYVGSCPELPAGQAIARLIVEPVRKSKIKNEWLHVAFPDNDVCWLDISVQDTLLLGI